jgi:hypothetical protein
MSERCITCKHCDLIPANNEQGICRFNSPGTALALSPQGPAGITLWPTVMTARDRCSHYDEQLVRPVEHIGFFPRVDKGGVN